MIYNRIPSPEKTTMTVLEMGNMLGLKKTDRYWLVHKKCFETKIIAGKMRVDLASFEKWYANQVKYHKVNGEEPGKELKEWSYSIRDIGEMLNITESVVYDLLNREHIETVLVDGWKRVPKKVFDQWYTEQNHYRTKEDREKDKEIEAATLSMPEMAHLLGITRNQVYEILRSKKYREYFEYVYIGDRKKIKRDSFEKWYNSQNEYLIDSKNDVPEVAQEKNRQIADYRRNRIYHSGKRRGNGNQEFLTANEASLLAGVSNKTIYAWCRKELFPVIKIGNNVRISRKQFESWLRQRKEEKAHGIN